MYLTDKFSRYCYVKPCYIIYFSNCNSGIYLTFSIIEEDLIFFINTIFIHSNQILEGQNKDLRGDKYVELLPSY